MTSKMKKEKKRFWSCENVRKSLTVKALTQKGLVRWSWGSDYSQVDLIFSAEPFVSVSNLSPCLECTVLLKQKGNKLEIRKFEIHV